MYAIKRRFFKKYFNNRQRQLLYGFANLFFVLFVILIINVIYLFKFSQVANVCVTSGGTIDLDTMTSHTNLLIYGSIGGIIVAGALCFAFAILLTHRFFGPMVSINRHFDELMKGNFDARVEIRKDDELHELCDRLNAFTAELRENYVRRQK